MPGYYFTFFNVSIKLKIMKTTKEQLYYRLTGTETPQFITEREEVIINKCLDLINILEEEIEVLNS